MDLVAPLAEPQTEVYVLKAVTEGGIESPYPPERFSTDENRGRAHHLEAAGFAHGRVVRRKVSVEMTRVEVLADGNAGVLDRVVREEQLATDDGRVGVALGVVYEGVQPAGGRNNVVVQE